MYSQINKFVIYCFSVVFLLSLLACGENISTPKPKGYPRIPFKAKSYKPFTEACHYEFDVPTYTNVVPDSAYNTQPCWYNVLYPDLKGELHISYYDISTPKMFAQMVNDAHELAYKHTVKAEAINEQKISIPSKNVYGLYYSIEGNAASSVQFFLTDSSKHYLRGSLYFLCQPNIDSLAPVINYVQQDINRMIETLHWK